MNPFAFLRRSTGFATPSQSTIDALAGGITSDSGEKVSIETATAITDVFAAVNIVSECVGMLPLKVYRDVAGETIEASDHRAYSMLHDAPNPLQPAYRFWSTVATHLLLWGNAFIEKLRDPNGLVSELWIIQPSWVTVEFNSSLRQKRFRIDDPNQGSRTLTDDRVLHIYGVTTDGLVGMSPIAQCRQSLGLARARERFEGDLYHNKPFLTGVINYPGKLNDTVKLRDSWSAIYGGAGTRNRHSVGVLEEGATYQPLSAPLADMQFVESAQLSKTQIANIFKLPPWYLGGSVGNSLTYQTVEGNETQFARHTIAPLTTCIQKFIANDRGIFPFQSWYPEFVLEALMRGDSQSRAAYYTALTTIGALLPEEVRARENLPPLTAAQQAEQIAQAELDRIRQEQALPSPQDQSA